MKITENHSKIIKLLAFGLLLLVIHPIGIQISKFLGFYAFDKIQHFLAGIFAGLIWLWLFNPKEKSIIITTLAFSLSIAIAWELFELAALKYFNSFARKYYLYSISFNEAFSDIIANLLGTTTLLLYKKRHH